jgi:ketosteroid isomerase-like protein
MNKALWRAILVAGLLGGNLHACTKTPAAATERMALEAAIQRWTTAVNAQDLAALKSTMTEDVELSEDSATTSGQDSAIRALRESVSHGRLAATSREITIAGDVAWHVVGLAQVQKTGDVQARGQALEIWKRVQGEWRLHRRMATGINAGALLTRPSTREPVLDRQQN